MRDIEAKYSQCSKQLSFGWGSGAMEVCLDQLLPANLHKLHVFSKALNDNIGHTPFGQPTAGRIVLDYIDAALSDTYALIETQKVQFMQAATEAGLRRSNYDLLCEHLGGADKLSKAITAHTKPLRQKTTEIKRELKADRRKLAASENRRDPAWFTAEIQYAISRKEQQLSETEKELQPWAAVADSHKAICNAVKTAGQLERNKTYLSQTLKEV